MNYWLFQGNPKAFDVDDYLTENEELTWNVRQAHYVSDIHVGDHVFIWRSDGGVKYSGGVVALAEVMSEPYEGESAWEVELKVHEYRLTEEEGMLMRHQLMELPMFDDLPVLRLKQNTNYKLSEKEFERLHAFWQRPERLEEQLQLSTLDQYLALFSEQAMDWFSEMDYIHDNHAFFQEFKGKVAQGELEWAYIQEIGQHINAFMSMPLARKRALGNKNAEIEKYRDSFRFLFSADVPVDERIDQFIHAEDYKLFGFGESVVSEIIGNVYADEYCFYNQRDRVALENILQIHPDYQRGDTFGQKFRKFQEALATHQVIERYEAIVGKQTDLPIYLEIDQFFSYLFETFQANEEMEPEEEETAIQYWVLAAGEDGKLWDQFERNQEIAIGWAKLGDLRQYSSRQEVGRVLQNVENLSYKPWNNAYANYNFANMMSIGDIVIMKKGRSAILGIGRITSDYQYEAKRGNYRSIRKVEWLHLGERSVEGFKLPMKTLTNFTSHEREVKQLLSLYEEVKMMEETNDLAYTKEDLLADLFIPEDQVDAMIDMLDYKQNIILQGPPGVGKTYVAKRLAFYHQSAKKEDNILFVQFHQSYAYEDFIRGYKPHEAGHFYLKNGLFYEFCQKAMANPSEKYYVIIDEINRGNLSKIFGELLMLIETDKRGPKHTIQLAYQKDGESGFYVPENLYIIGTMNTADRSLAMVDFALRRRFAFLTLEPAFHSEIFQEYLRKKGISQGFIEKIVTAMQEINQEIVNDTINAGRGFEIGHSYFTPSKAMDEDEQRWFDRIVRLEIEPLLKEYWFDQEEKVRELLAKLQ
ncbi:AAA family ATPase [Bacillus sp. REN10]|uniref:AAA family ATPase n=1 Tax=Bacillus sp. REN10 TaxID=2782541 RepID=UPI00193B7D77|nr:AAA family ATPase [Bacillus sp. REN10]